MTGPFDLKGVARKGVERILRRGVDVVSTDSIEGGVVNDETVNDLLGDGLEVDTETLQLVAAVLQDGQNFDGQGESDFTNLNSVATEDIQNSVWDDGRNYLLPTSLAQMPTHIITYPWETTAGIQTNASGSATINTPGSRTVEPTTGSTDGSTLTTRTITGTPLRVYREGSRWIVRVLVDGTGLESGSNQVPKWELYLGNSIFTFSDTSERAGFRITGDTTLQASVANGSSQTTEDMGTAQFGSLSLFVIDLINDDSVTLKYWDGIVETANTPPTLETTISTNVPTGSLDGGLGWHMENEPASANSYSFRIHPSSQVVTVE